MWQNFNYTDPANPTTAASVELTNAESYMQIGAFPTPGYGDGDLPPAKDMLPWFSGDGGVFKAEAFDSKCWNRSLSQPTSCQENCLEYFDMFNATWFNLGDLYCMESYPVEGLTGEEVVPAGNVSVVLTNQCSQYTYGPKGGDEVIMHTVTDTFGNVYALQSSTTNATTPDEWTTVVDSAVFPPGWSVGKETLTEDEIHYSYLIGDDCWLVILKDSAGSAWQQYVYAEPLEQSSFLSSFECPPLAKGGLNLTTPDLPTMGTGGMSSPSLPSSSGGYERVGQVAALALALRLMF